MRTELYATPRNVTDLRDCYFYHTVDLPGIGVVYGDWDLRGRLADYAGGVEFKGRSVLDVGSATGFLTFEMERCGAQVVSFDIGSALDMDRLPFVHSLYNTNRTKWLQEADCIIERVKNSYWFSHRLYRSSAKVLYGDVYHLPQEIGTFDVVMIGQILVHLRDPVRAISELAKVASDTLIITEGMLDTKDPVMRLCADPLTGPDWSWWHLSCGLYEKLLKILGFDPLHFTRSTFRSRQLGPTTLTTVVARKDPKSTSGAGFGAW